MEYYEIHIVIDISPYIHAHIYRGNISYIYIHIDMKTKTLLREKIQVCVQTQYAKESNLFNALFT